MADVMSVNSEWFRTTELPFWGSWAIRLLRFNRIPKHIAFIMDGNRRYARSHEMDSVVEGHSKGFDQLTRVLEWCNMLNVREVTVYAFSLENFKRSDEEVNGLFKMAEEKFGKLLEEKERLEKQQVCFRFFGNMTKLPPVLRDLVEKVEAATKDYTRAFCNICLAYTSQDEMTRAVNRIHEDVKAGRLQKDEITVQKFEAALDTRNSFPVDLLIRTSGEHRLSDFLLWQCSDTYLHFDDVLWPDFGFWHLFKAIVAYQTSSKPIREDSFPK